MTKASDKLKSFSKNDIKKLLENDGQCHDLVSRYLQDRNQDYNGYIIHTATNATDGIDDCLSKAIYILYCKEIDYVFIARKKKIICVVPNWNWKPIQGLKTLGLLLRHDNNHKYV